MAPIPPELGLSEAELDEVLTTTWNMRIATLGPGQRMNLTPLYFAWAGRRIYFYGRGQKIVNLRRHPDATVLVDLNERYGELMGAMLQGKATVLEDAAAEAADPYLEQARLQMGTKYRAPEDGSTSSRNSATAGGRSRRWVVVIPDRIVTWDNHKLGQTPR